MNDQLLTQWQNVIESTITKEYFYKLENAIILLDVAIDDIDWIFKILKRNLQLLKYQFKQFVIGWNIDWSHFHVLEWNKEIDEKYLDQLKAVCKENNESQETRRQMKEKYLLLRDEWST